MLSDDIVYSTGQDGALFCPVCHKSPCACPAAPAKARQAEPVRIRFRRGHKGSGMTMITRLWMHPAGKEELLRKFKKKLGVGGTVKLGELELQGDHLDAVESELKTLGYKVKRQG